MKSEYAFTLPRGFVDAEGQVHREGTMRLATARDEIEPLRQVEVRQNEAYLSVLLLARTITRIGGLTEITPDVVEELYAADFDHLQRLYERINTDGEAVGAVAWRAGVNEFEADLTEMEDGRLGECRGRPPRRSSGSRPASRSISTGRSTRSSTSSTTTGAVFSEKPRPSPD